MNNSARSTRSIDARRALLRPQSMRFGWLFFSTNVRSRGAIVLRLVSLAFLPLLGASTVGCGSCGGETNFCEIEDEDNVEGYNADIPNPESMVGDPGGETNFKRPLSVDDLESDWQLRYCEADSECDFGLCICGVCTISCRSNRDCEGRANGICQEKASEALVNLCDAEDNESSGGICLPSCRQDKDCRLNQACVAGTCPTAR